nr:NAD(P)/FAD-dependent oxidoreductase [Olsenella profusa]
MPDAADVAVVGGGAAGLAAAIAAGEAGARVVVLERSAECGRTILATGNGRCNLANARLCPDRYNDPAFVEAVCGDAARFRGDVLAFFDACGLQTVLEEQGRLYPCSRQAASVRAVLLARAGRAGATLAPAREVTSVAHADGGWVVTWAGAEGAVASGSLRAGAVVFAAGGGEALTRSLGLACSPFRPVLCALACEPQGAALSLADLDGRRAHACARLLRDGAEVARERGEVLFRPYGISGIVAFDLSRTARPGDVVSLAFADGMLDEADARGLAGRAGSCAGFLDPAIESVLAATGADVVSLALDLRLRVTGPAEPERAQVTRGGLLTEQFLPGTLEAREARGLFACGEALDVDGACGGFNLAWAWRSGLVAGAAAAQAR